MIMVGQRSIVSIATCLFLLFVVGYEVVRCELLYNLGDILRSSNTTGSNGSFAEPFQSDVEHQMMDIALPLNETTIYYIERKVNGSTHLESVVKKIEVSTEEGMGSISPVAGPFRIGQALGSSKLTGLLLLNETTLLIADEDDKLLRMVDVRTPQEMNPVNPNPNSQGPLRLTKHPTQKKLFVSEYDRIITVSSESPLNSGGNLVAGPAGFELGFADSNPSIRDARFRWPMIGARSISPSGNSLYVADFSNNAVRQVDTRTGFTKTIYGAIPPNFDVSNASGLVTENIKQPFSLALTTDGCNLFVAELWGSGSIHWLKFREPDGNVEGAEKVASLVNSNDSSQIGFTSLILSKDDQYLFAGLATNLTLGRILKFQVNRSALHVCRTPPSPSPASVTALYAGIGVGGAALILCIIGVVVGIIHREAIKAMWLRRSSWERQRNEGKEVDGERKKHFAKSPVPSAASTEFSLPSSQTGSGISGSWDAGVDKLSVQAICKFRLSELQEATGNFDDAHLLTGKGGGYGDVYRTSLMVGDVVTDVAIKVMRGQFDNLKYRQFVAEVNTLSRVAQRNLCKLLGYCVEEDRCILVYPFISGGSLHDRLHNYAKKRVPGDQLDSDTSGESGEPLTWANRMSIAKQIAAALRYLHFDADTPILHRDVKCSNVLMEGKKDHLHVYLTDFGLATSQEAAVDGRTAMLEIGQTVFTQTRSGTPGYMAPEYSIMWKLTTMNDVYAFGVVLLELVTGRKAVIHDEEFGSMSLVSWARQWLSRSDVTFQQMEEIIDPDIRPTLTSEECEMAFKLAMLAHMCTQEAPMKRPSMNVVMERILNIKRGYQSLAGPESHN